MLEILQFVCSSFWLWAGTMLLVYAVGDVMIKAVKMWRRSAQEKS